MEALKITGQAPAAFDPMSKDAEILEAFEMVRGARAEMYSFDNISQELSDEENQRLDAICLEAEAGVTGNWATTPTGIAARLMLAIPGINQARWVDSTLMQHGLLALYTEREHLCGNDAQLVQAAYELLHLEWELALSAYKASKDSFEAVLSLKSFIEAERFHPRDGRGDTPFMTELDRQLDQMEDRASNDSEIARLFATLAPDLHAYKEKVTIAIHEGLEKEVAVHLVRDANFLFAAASAQPAKEA